MTTVRVSCIVCEASLELDARDVVLHLAGPETDARNRYGFTCPACTVFVVRPAGPAVVEALLATDVELSTGDAAPWERLALADTVHTVAERTEADDLGPFTEADISWFVELLEDETLLADWLAGRV